MFLILPQAEACGSNLMNSFAVYLAGQTALTMKTTVIPEEVHTVLEFCQRDLPGFVTVNTALRNLSLRSHSLGIYLYFSNVLTLPTTSFLLPTSKSFCTNSKMG